MELGDFFVGKNTIFLVGNECEQKAQRYSIDAELTSMLKSCGWNDLSDSEYDMSASQPNQVFFYTFLHIIKQSPQMQLIVQFKAPILHSNLCSNCTLFNNTQQFFFHFGRSEPRYIWHPEPRRSSS